MWSYFPSVTATPNTLKLLTASLKLAVMVEKSSHVPYMVHDVVKVLIRLTEKPSREILRQMTEHSIIPLTLSVGVREIQCNTKCD